MKKIILVTLALGAMLLGFTVVSCKSKEEKTAAADQVPKSESSYAFGVAIGNSLKATGVDIDYTAFVNGMKDVLDKNAPKITMDEANDKIQAALGAAMAKKGEESLAAEKKFLEENGKKAGVTTTVSGLQYEVLKEGSGAKPTGTDTVKVDYVGTLLDGTKFDSSIDRGEPAVFPLDRVIPGWTEGIQLMAVGSKYKLYIPSNLAYGEQGAGELIGPNSTLVFEVDLLSIEK